ncbi:MAG: TldD/PmbA family protein [Alphaproteobacteria bacterium]|nr:TldD/PmbA family protein [Alphaproteobacteria bacterium]
MTKAKTSSTATVQADLGLLGELVADARRAGADAADAMLVRGRSLSVELRMRAPEKTERSEGVDLGLRVFIGKRQASVSSSDLSAPALKQVVERAVAMARAVPEDEFCGLAPEEALARDWPQLEMEDQKEHAAEKLIDRARACEEAALGVAGVTNSGGAEASWGRSTVALAASNGFAGGYGSSRYSVSVSVMAGEGTGMERDYDFTSTVFDRDLDKAEAVGRSAGERAVRRLKPRKGPTAQLPVVFDPRVSNSLLGHLLGAISGASVARGTSFLKDQLGQRILPEGVDVIDDPHRQRGLRSRPFDGEGLATRRMALVEDGVLKTWLLDLRSARQLKLAPTGHAARDTSGPPGPSASNVYLAAGRIARDALLAGIDQGFYVNELMGFGVNGVTGDYSRGASGFWIEKGQLAYPVSEMTIAGNLKAMFKAITAADDLVFKYGTNAPTLRVDGMTIAGA